MNPAKGRSVPAIVVPGVLAVSFALRAYISSHGGQYFFGDEARYDVGARLYRAVTVWDGDSVCAILGSPEHGVFAIVAALISGLQHLLAQLTPYGDWSNPANVGFTIWISALVMAAVYTINLWLLYVIAKAMDRGSDAAVWTLLLAASANSFFYPARHLLPYGCSIAVTLSAIRVGFGRPAFYRALLCGFLLATGYHIYNGYWYLVPSLGLAFVWWWRREPQFARLTRAIIAGIVLGLMLPLAIGSLCGGARYWSTMAAFSRSVTQGLFREGWSLPWEFLWHSEGLMLVAIVMAVILAIAKASRPTRTAWLWIGVIGVGYGLLVLTSVILERFVVYARTVLPFTAFLSLLGGWAAAQLIPKARLPRVAVLVGIAIISTIHFAPHFSFTFPREFEIAVLRNYGNPKHTLSVSGSLYIPLAMPVTRSDLALVNAQLLYPVRDYIGFPAGKVVLSLPHPLSYKPFQYESHTPRERELLRTHDIRMKLIELADPRLPDDLPAALRFRNDERPTGR